MCPNERNVAYSPGSLSWVLVAKFTKAVNVVVFVPGYEKFWLRLRLLLKFAPFCERNSFQCIELYVDGIKNEAYTD